MSIEEKVQKIVCEQLGVSAEEVKLEASFIDDLGADSLDTVELVMAFEEEFDIEIPDEEAEAIQTVKNAVDYINSKDRPLGLYYFGEDTKEKDFVLDNTTSGGVTVNDVISHITMEDLPFGGVGPSGMGSYHGYDGFKEFSHAKSVYKQSWLNLNKVAGLVPPYKKKEDNAKSA